MTARAIPAGPDELTAEWLSDVLRAGGHITHEAAVTSFNTERVGEGGGFLGLIVRLRPKYEPDQPNAPQTMIAKFPSPLEGARTIANLYGAYEREVRFYADLSEDVGVCAPRCFHSDMDPAAATYLLLLEDLAGTGTIGDQVQGCSEEEALLTVSELARLHAQWWNSPKLDRFGWLQRGSDLVRASMEGLYPQVWQTFMQLFGDHLTPELERAMPDLNQGILHLLLQLDERQQTLVHGDYRLDNLFFPGDGAKYRLAVIDWQSPNRGWGAYDLAYFVGCSLPADQRRSWEKRILETYHAALVEGGVHDYAPDRLSDDYHKSLLISLGITVVSGATLERSNERAVELWELIFDRLVGTITDTEALELLPA